MKTKQDVADWIESVDELTTQRADIDDELHEAWLIVYGRGLDDEEEDVIADAWSE